MKRWASTKRGPGADSDRQEESQTYKGEEQGKFTMGNNGDEERAMKKQGSRKISEILICKETKVQGSNQAGKTDQ